MESTLLDFDQVLDVVCSLDDEQVKSLYAAMSDSFLAAFGETPLVSGDRVIKASQEIIAVTRMAFHLRERLSEKQFDCIQSSWNFCGLSIYADDWKDVLEVNN